MFYTYLRSFSSLSLSSIFAKLLRGCSEPAEQVAKLSLNRCGAVDRLEYFDPGLLMMRFRLLVVVYRICGMPFVHLASFRHAFLNYHFQYTYVSAEVVVFKTHFEGVKY